MVAIESTLSSPTPPPINIDRPVPAQMLQQMAAAIIVQLEGNTSPALILNMIRRHADVLELEIRKSVRPEEEADAFDGRDYNDPNRRY